MKRVCLVFVLLLVVPIAPSQPATPAPLDGAVSNAFLDLLVNDAGSPALRTTGGSPATPADDDQLLLFGANTSFTSVWIDGTATSLRDTTPTAGPTADGDAITTTWTVGEVQIAQTYALTTNPYTGRPDTMQVITTLRNTGAAEHEAGLRVLLDVLVGGSDVATLLVPGAGVVTTERDYQTTLPPFYRIFGEARGQLDAVQALGLLVAPGTTAHRGEPVEPPDRFVVGRWSELDATVWDYTVTPDAALDDSAVALWWEPAPLAPGATRSVTTFYGLAGWVATEAWFDAPAGMACEDRGFTAMLWVRNQGEAAWTGGQATLTLPAGLALAEGESVTKSLGDVPAGDAQSIAWQLVAAQAGDWNYSAQITFTEGDPLTAEGTVSVPACDGTSTPTHTPTATLPATATLTPTTPVPVQASPTLTPTGTPTTTQEWDVYLPLICRDD